MRTIEGAAATGRRIEPGGKGRIPYIAAIICAAVFAIGLCAPPLSAEIADDLRLRLEAPSDQALKIAGEPFYAGSVLREFYESRSFEPAWFKEGRIRKDVVAQLRSALAGAYDHGLNPADYHAPLIERLTGGGSRSGKLSVKERTDIDLVLSDAYLMLASHYLAGRVNPETLDAEWFANRRQHDLARRLEEALRSATVDQSLTALLPGQSEYWRLVESLKSLRRASAGGGWPTVPAGPTLKPGMDDERVTAIRERLRAAGIEVAKEDRPSLFTPAVEKAVRLFQERNGLDPDGVVGPQTMAVFNVPTQARIEKVRVNLERWRWLPGDLGQRHVLVNIAGFYVDAVEDGKTVFRNKVIVGRDYRRTPVFSDRISYVVLNPTWTVPPKLAVQDKLPVIKKDPEYLSRLNFKVYRGWGADRTEIDPATVDWQSLSPGNFPYTLVQMPGPANALGDMKIMFPNRFNVYLHDTPDRGLFARAARAFSSGCIRVQNPMELVEWLMKPGGPGRPQLDAILQGKAEKSISLPQRVPVHLLYWTTWVEDDGTIRYVPDIYRRDEPLLAALDSAPPR